MKSRPRYDGYAKRAEVVRRHAVDVRARSVAASAAHFESRRAAVVPEREDVGETRRGDARQLGQALDQLLAQRQSSVNGVAAGVHVDAGDQPSLDVESRVHRGDPHETSQHQRRQDQQNEARRDLADDESVAQAQPPRDAKTRAALHDGTRRRAWSLARLAQARTAGR